MVMASAGQPAAVVQAGPTLLWMRVGDLRANDHLGVTQLLATAQAGHSVAAVFVFDEEEMHAWAPSFVRYVYASVAALRSTIESMGGQLLVRVGDPATVLSAVAAEVGATSILAKEELEWVRQHRVQYTKAALQTAGLPLRTWEDALRPWGGDVQAFPLRKEDYGYPNKGVPAQPTQLPAPTADTPTAPLAALKAVAAAGEMPPLAQVEAWGLAEETADEKLATELATVREFMLQPSEVRKRAMVDDTFVTAKQSYAWTQVDLDGEPPVVPFRLTGGEAEAREYYAGAWLDFYVATNKPEWQRMQQRILADKNTAFYFVFRSAIAAGCISSRQIWHDTRESERKSYRVTDLGGLACRTMEQRDFEAHVARRDHQLQGEGPGWPLVGYYYLSAGGLQG